jgi:amino acid transporter
MFYKWKESVLKKSLSSSSLLVFGFANIFGPQIFIMLAGLINISGIYGIWTLIICAFICFLIALVYSEITLSIPVAGVVLHSVNDALGRFPSFIVGWSQLLGNISFAAVCASAFGLFIGKPIIGAILILILITIMELRGITELGKIEIILVLFIISFFFIIFFSNFSTLPNIFENSFVPKTFNDFKRIFFGIGFFFLAFTGFEDTTTYSEEVKDIKKLPLIMFSLIFIISVIFISIYFLLISNINSNDALLLKNPLVFLGSKLFGNFSENLVIIVGISATVSSLITTLSTSARNVFSLAEKGFLPKKLYDLNSEKIPVYSILFSSLFVLFLVLLNKLTLLVYLANFLYFFIVIFVALSVIKLRKKRKFLERPFKIPLFPVIPLLLIFLMIVLVFFLELQSIAYGLIWFFIGFIVYMLKVVGKTRLKIAMAGGNILCSVLLLLLLFIIKELIPEINLLLSIFVYIVLGLYILFSLVLINKLLKNYRKSKH